MKKHNSPQILKTVYSAVFLALCYLLPFFTAGSPALGNMLCLMHIPVFLCGYICSPIWGLAVGITAPLLRSLTLGMPSFFPTAVAMSLELGTYGFLSGFLYRIFPKKLPFCYLAQILSMICGRAVWGIARLACAGFNFSDFPPQAFLAGAFTGAIPGIFLQLILIVPLFTLIKHSEFLPESGSNILL